MKRLLMVLAIFLLAVASGVLIAQTGAQKVYEVSTTGITAPKLLEAATPGYTDEAKKKKIEGDVVLIVVVDEKGDVTEPKVKKSLGYGLDESAIEAAKYFKYKPAVKDDQPVACRVEIPFNFYLTKE